LFLVWQPLRSLAPFQESQFAVKNNCAAGADISARDSSAW
jgi:hypothetical protein